MQQTYSKVKVSANSETFVIFLRFVHLNFHSILTFLDFREKRQ